jgi:hypothetical protein
MLPNILLSHLGGFGSKLLAQRIVQPSDTIDFVDSTLSKVWLVILFVVVWFCPNTQQIMYKFSPTLGRIQPGPFAGALSWRPNAVWACAVGALLCLGVLSLGGTSEFLYFQF